MENQPEKRLLMLGIIISLIAGLLLGIITERPYIGIAAGIFSAYLVQRLSKYSEKKLNENQ